jgi:EAL domain-containing protein (putative c-di-GMP-specific phosphodiesterase class I)
VQLALDDFGTGYSSLSYLRNFPLDGVKVDRAFTDGLGGSERDVAIMRAIVEMCSALGLSVVAEGVESAAQLEQLEKLGCHHVQGYLLCRPMPAEELTGFLASRLVPIATDPPMAPAAARSRTRPVQLV